MVLTGLMHPHGRLPPLQAIGRTTTFDDVDNTLYFSLESDVGYPGEQSFFPEREQRKFGQNDGELATKLLQRSFHVLEPGSHVCKKTPEHSSSSFTHCTNGMSIARQYAQLRHLMEEQAILDFVRDYVFRIKALTAFVKDLENLVYNEYQTWYSIMHNSLTHAPNSKLFCLTTVCEDLRIHVNHWNCIKQRLYTDRWLKTSQKRLSFELDLVRQVLFKLQDCAIWWVERLIKIGLEVFGNSDGESVTQDMLWNICRGMEEFNSIVTSVHHTPGKEGSQPLFPLKCHNRHRSLQLTARGNNCIPHIGSSLRPISFSRVLGIISGERAKYAAVKAHRFFTTSDWFVTLVHNTNLVHFFWKVEDSRIRSVKQANCCSVQSENQQTSDYYTTSSVASPNLVSPLFQIHNMAMPDLSVNSPLIDFAEQEQDFIGRFLNVASSSTNLLRKNGTSVDRGSGKSKGYRSPARPPRGPVDESALLRSDLKRKCVSWGDSVDNSVRLQVASRYMETLWQGFQIQLDMFFKDCLWGLEDDYVDTELGSIVLCRETTVMIVRQLIAHSCAQDHFPSGCVSPLMSVRRDLLHSSAFTAWHSGLCRALGSFVTDKFYPCPLVTGDYSTKTGMLLRDTFQPLHCALTDQAVGEKLTSKGAIPKPRPDLWVVVKLASRLLSTCHTAHLWCYSKTYQLLASWSIGSFLLVTQTDLKMLADETAHGVRLTQTLLNLIIGSSGIPLQNPLAQELASLNQQLQDISGQLQTLSGAAMKLFGEKCRSKSSQVFQDVMPPGKTWKRRTSEGHPTKHSAYVEEAIDCILEPVLEGVNKLKSTSQVGVISIATVAMCEAWTEFILKEKIKFSVDGAYQLALDFRL
ncbi:uncharacterized protein LOC135468263 isoform X2 [Liolophura sinensis]|uniref:uncharacterized protein LOC135468263 isoform X2 n=1 Tax=Liolophura sinensis TaxID=3198878 RepID=UPI0031595EA2